jgi:steroid 5-alpha reductase family enzyme
MPAAMIDGSAYLYALAAISVAAALVWVISVLRRDVGIVDSLWSLMILGSLGVYAGLAESTGPRTVLVMVLVAAWAVRLSLHITVRNHGEPEDRRYQQIRENNQPHFWLKSLFIVFLLQSFLAWVVSLSGVAAVAGQAPLGPLDYAGAALWLLGMFFEVVGDWQLARFQRNRDSSGEVLDTGLWRYTRHPNYFGEAVIWWGIFLIALSAGAWWAVVSPVVMTVLLLRVSGVALLEKDIGDRRPEYRDYIKRTNAFFPGPPKAASVKGG